MSQITELGNRVWAIRHEWYDLNVTVIAGERGLLVVDTHASSGSAREVIEDVGRLSTSPVVGLVNTHHHFDHWFGNHAFREEYGELPITAHEDCVGSMLDHGRQVQLEASSWPHPRSAEVAQAPLLPADRGFSSVSTVDLGDRVVELVHPGRGHTAGDIVVRVDDADVLIAGDLVEESGMPAYGGDCWPMEWPRSLDLVLSLVGERTRVVPGHGAPVDRDFVQEQQAAIDVVAETIRDLAGRGVPEDQALATGDWPYPREGLAEAVHRGYEALPRSARRLPLV